jgi:hypothetical protein
VDPLLYIFDEKETVRTDICSTVPYLLFDTLIKGRVSQYFLKSFLALYSTDRCMPLQELFFVGFVSSLQFNVKLFVFQAANAKSSLTDGVGWINIHSG